MSELLSWRTPLAGWPPLAPGWLPPPRDRWLGRSVSALTKCTRLQNGISLGLGEDKLQPTVAWKHGNKVGGRKWLNLKLRHRPRKPDRGGSVLQHRHSLDDDDKRPGSQVSSSSSLWKILPLLFVAGQIYVCDATPAPLPAAVCWPPNYQSVVQAQDVTLHLTQTVSTADMNIFSVWSFALWLLTVFC